MAPKAKRAARTFAAVAALLALSGFVLGGLALQETLGASTRSGAPNEVAHELRGIAIIKPPSGGSKANHDPAGAPVEPARQVIAHTAQPPVVVTQPKVTKSNMCDPPFTMDPATGRKKYKLECLK
jgi:hypothetical protein